jgi:Mg-chelatase subunit ChlD
MLGNYGVLLAQWEQSDPELLRKLLTRTWNRLDERIRKRFLHLMIGMIYRVSRSELIRRGAPTGDIATVPFAFSGDELDLDRTIEATVEHPLPRYENLFVQDRKKRKSAAVIIMDASGSMQGEKLSMAAIAVTSLAVNLDARDEYGVVLFSEKVNVCKRVDQAKPLDEVIHTVLNIRPEGRTNIGLGLLAGLTEIQRSTVDSRSGILLTDGQQNTGQDPLGIARRFPMLHVVVLPGGNPELAGQIAEKGRGSLILLKGIEDVPRAIVRCLCR